MQSAHRITGRHKLTRCRVIAVVSALMALLCLKPVAVYAETVQPLRCLAENIYFEARGETDAGKLAVALVTLNRVKSERFPNTICEVVWQPEQFSWTINRKMHSNYRKPPQNKNWRKALSIARLAMFGAQYNAVGDATHYHASYVRPRWARAKRPVAKLGRHLFYIL